MQTLFKYLKESWFGGITVFIESVWQRPIAMSMSFILQVFECARAPWSLNVLKSMTTAKVLQLSSIVRYSLLHMGDSLSASLCARVLIVFSLVLFDKSRSNSCILSAFVLPRCGGFCLSVFCVCGDCY